MNKKKTWVYLAVLLFFAGTISAEQFAYVGARAVGMGGANAVAAHDATAQWHNPSIFGFMDQPTEDSEEATTTNTTSTSTSEVAQVATSNDTNTTAAATNEVLSTDEGEPLDPDKVEVEPVDESEYNLLDNNGLADRVWGWNLMGGGMGYTMTKDMGHYLGMLSEVDMAVFESNGLVDHPDSVSSLLAIGGGLYGMSEQGNALYVEGSVGSSLRCGHFSVGFRMFGEAIAYLDNLDDTHLGIDQTQAQFVSSINYAAAQNSGFNAATHTISTLSSAQVSSLTASLGDVDAVKFIDYELAELKNKETFDQKDIDNAVNLVNKITYNAAGQPDSLENNRSTIFTRAFGVAEIPISYGKAINDNWSFGATIKGMYGTIAGTKVWFFDGESTEDAINAASEDAQTSMNFGLDLGVLYRIPNFQFGLVGHNLNSPKFDGYTTTITVKDDLGNPLFNETIQVADVRIDPQVTLGAAFIPNERFTLEANYDLLKTGTLLNDYAIQRLSFGTEVDLWLLALRLGAYKNLASDWQDWVATGGLGLNLYIFRIDVGGAYGLGEPVTYDGQDIPSEARVYAELSLDF